MYLIVLCNIIEIIYSFSINSRAARLAFALTSTPIDEELRLVYTIRIAYCCTTRNATPSMLFYISSQTQLELRG